MLSPVHYSYCCRLYSISLFPSPQLLVDIFHTHRCFPHIHPLQLHPKCIAVKRPSFHLYMSVTYGSRWPIICTGHPSSWCCHLPLGSTLPLVIPLGYFTTFLTAPLCPCPCTGRLKILIPSRSHTSVVPSCHTPNGYFVYRFLINVIYANMT